MGSYVQGNNYNLIVEYPNHGSLEEYLQSSSPPCSALDLQRFWKNAMSLLVGLHQIHNTSSFDTNTGSIVGIHADIKPHNILVFGNNDPSSYDLTFKLSDLRVSSVKSSIGSNRLVAGIQTYSGLTHTLTTNIRYLSSIGAPEYSLANIDRGRARSCDIWSLGCVFMELTAWLIGGSDGLKGFRDRRSKELSIQEELEPAFHNGATPLNEVLLMYEHAKARLKPYDDWSGIVLDLVENHMLVSSENGRLGARDIHDLWKERVKTHAHRSPMVDSDDTCLISSAISNGRQSWGTNESAKDVAEGESRCMDQSNMVELGAVPDLAFCRRKFHRNRKQYVTTHSEF